VGFLELDDFLLNHNLTEYKNKFFIHNDFCESEKFFSPYQEELKRIFKPEVTKLSPPALDWKSVIEGTIISGKIPVAIHVRRGNYISSKIYLKLLKFYSMKQVTIIFHNFLIIVIIQTTRNTGQLQFPFTLQL